MAFRGNIYIGEQKTAKKIRARDSRLRARARWRGASLVFFSGGGAARRWCD